MRTEEEFIKDLEKFIQKNFEIEDRMKLRTLLIERIVEKLEGLRN